MTDFIHRIEYWGLRALLACGRLVPLALLRRAFEGVAWAWFRLDRHHRRIVLANLAIGFPDWDEPRRREVGARAIANWGRLGAELIHGREFLDEPRRREFAELDRVVARELEKGRGLLILSAHTANFELLARMTGRLDRELVLFHRAMTNRYVNRFLISERARVGVGTLARGVAVRDAFRVLGRGGVIVAPMDQNQPAGRGVFVEMFGRQASTSTFLARLSLATGAPVLPVFALWSDDGLVPSFFPVVEPPRNRAACRDTAIRELTACYTGEIERFVREHPDQWNWAHRRWKTRPRDSPKWAKEAA